jgi:hypothetical protein
VHNRAGYDLEDHHARAGVVAGKGQPFPVSPGIPAGFGVVEGGEIPYRPEALAKRNENATQGLAADPLAQCYMPGVPRSIYMDFPFQIVQTPKHVAFIHEFEHSVRIVYTDGTPHTKGIDSWMGDSRGHYEGNTLVVDSIGYNDRTWFDMAGNYHSDALHIVERFTRTSPDVIQYEATIEDPRVFTRPWKISMPIYRHAEQNFRLLEYPCAAMAEEAAGTWTPRYLGGGPPRK